MAVACGFADEVRSVPQFHPRQSHIVTASSRGDERNRFAKPQATPIRLLQLTPRVVSDNPTRTLATVSTSHAAPSRISAARCSMFAARCWMLNV